MISNAITIVISIIIIIVIISIIFMNLHCCRILGHQAAAGVHLRGPEAGKRKRVTRKADGNMTES